MNEVLAVLYYCFVVNDYSEDKDEDPVIPSMYHESDLFFSFSNFSIIYKSFSIISIFKENFFFTANKIGHQI